MWGFSGLVAVDQDYNEATLISGRIDSKDEWVYIQRRNGRIRIWTGNACDACSVDLLSLRRCDIHKDLVLVAVQCRLID